MDKAEMENININFCNFYFSDLKIQVKSRASYNAPREEWRRPRCHGVCWWVWWTAWWEKNALWWTACKHDALEYLVKETSECCTQLEDKKIWLNSHLTCGWLFDGWQRLCFFFFFSPLNKTEATSRSEFTWSWMFLLSSSLSDLTNLEQTFMSKRLGRMNLMPMATFGGFVSSGAAPTDCSVLIALRSGMTQIPSMSSTDRSAADTVTRSIQRGFD